jgi:hypothetical protein
MRTDASTASESGVLAPWIMPRISRFDALGPESFGRQQHPNTLQLACRVGGQPRRRASFPTKVVFKSVDVICRMSGPFCVWSASPRDYALRVRRWSALRTVRSLQYSRRAASCSVCRCRVRKCRVAFTLVGAVRELSATTFALVAVTCMLVGVACILDNVTFALVAVTLHAVAAICVLVDVAFDSVGVAFNFVGVG